jgi:DNA-binding SARP family transcriptional activator
MLRVNLFGTGQAKYFDRHLAGFPNQQACLLFCYLLLNKDHPHYRERLAAVFWGDYPTDKARKYLRNALWKLRQVLESAGAPADEYLWITDDTVAFINTSSYSLDVERFEKKTRQILINDIDVYKGDLLDRFYEDWCLYDRERLRLTFLNALNKLMEHYGKTRGFERGIAYGERILTMDQTREKVHRQMMWLYWQLGARDNALAQYKLCKQILREELGIQPMAATQTLYEKIVHNQGVPATWEEARTSSTGKPTPKQLASVALKKLQKLQDQIDDMHTEISTLERLFNEALSDQI